MSQGQFSSNVLSGLLFDYFSLKDCYKMQGGGNVCNALERYMEKRMREKVRNSFPCAKYCQ